MLDRDFIAVVPTLDRRVEGMAYSRCHLPDAAKLDDDVFMIHLSNVHVECTSVNMEYVRARAVEMFVADYPDKALALRSICDRSGLAGDALAKACGWTRRNGPQPYLEGRPLTLKIAAKFVGGLEGLGRPPIKASEIWALVEDQSTIEKVRTATGPAPNAEALKIAMKAVLHGLPLLPMTDEAAESYTLAVLHAARLIGNDPARQANPDVIGTALEAATSRFLAESPPA